LTPTVCELERIPTKCHKKKTREGTFGRRLIPSGRRSNPHYHPNNHLKHTHTPNGPHTTIHRAPCNNHRRQKTRRPSGTTNKPSGSAAVQNTMPPPPQQHQTIETQEDMQQDSEEEIEAVIKDELARLRQENERLCLMQEHMARRW
jgi:hypothetical protein